MQFAYLNHHRQTICLMMQYVCSATNITAFQNVEAYELLSDT